MRVSKALSALLVANVGGTSAGVSNNRNLQMALTRNIETIHSSCDLDAMMCSNDFTFTSSFPIVRPDVIGLRIGSPPDIVPMLDEMINFTIEQVGTTGKNDDFIAMDKMFDEIFNSFFKDSSELAGVIAAHGKELMEREQDPPRRRLACRMAHMNAQPVLARNDMAVTPLKVVPRLNYGEKVDSCLWKRFLTGRIISPMCSAALQGAKSSFLDMEELMQKSFSQAQDADYDDAYYRMEEIGFALSLLGTILFIVSLLFLVKLFFKKNKAHLRTPQMRRLKRSILREVYANPELKAMVQSKIDQDMGDEPPISRKEREFGDETKPTGTCCRCVDTFFLSLPMVALCLLLCFTSVTNPGLVLFVGGPVIFLLVIYHMCRLCWVSGEDEIEHETGACQSCGVDTSSLCGSCESCVNCCVCESSNRDSPTYLESNERAKEKFDGEVYVAVPAVV